MQINDIREGFDVFLHDGDKAIAAVRRVHAANSEFVIYVENGGDFTLPFDVVKDVHDGKVVLHSGKLDLRLKQAISGAHIAEDPRI
jgi:hypothetical protein